MRYHNITTDDMLNGDGLRTVLWVAGCEHRCRGCHNPITWDVDGGVPFDEAAEPGAFREALRGLHKRNNVQRRRPAPQAQPRRDNQACEESSRDSAGKTIWLYTGYSWEDISDLEIIPLLDVLVDGKYVEAVRDPKLHWKGSSNQRVIDVQETLRLGKVVLFD